MDHDETATASNNSLQANPRLKRTALEDNDIEAIATELGMTAAEVEDALLQRRASPSIPALPDVVVLKGMAVGLSMGFAGSIGLLLVDSGSSSHWPELLSVLAIVGVEFVLTKVLRGKSRLLQYQIANASIWCTFGLVLLPATDWSGIAGGAAVGAAAGAAFILLDDARKKYTRIKSAAQRIFALSRKRANTDKESDHVDRPLRHQLVGGF